MTSSVAAKLAFFPPSPPSYKVVTDKVTGQTVASRPIPTPRKRGNPQASDPKRHRDNGHVREAPDGKLDDDLLAWKRRRSGTNIRLHGSVGSGPTLDLATSIESRCTSQPHPLRFKSNGTADEVVDCCHGKQLRELCKNKKSRRVWTGERSLDRAECKAPPKSHESKKTSSSKLRISFDHHLGRRSRRSVDCHDKTRKSVDHSHEIENVDRVPSDS
ncbi:hypothetical protein YC2023_068965 [Brassica napus]